MNILKEDFNFIYQEIRKAFEVFQQENVPDEVLKETKDKILSFLPSFDYLIYQYREDRFPYSLYRVRQEQAISEDESIRAASTFSYPAPEKCHVARANKEGCPVFYVADSIGTAIKEASCERGQIVYLSEWTFTNPKDTHFFLFFREQLPEKSFWRQAQKYQQEQLENRLQHLSQEAKKQWQELYNIYYEAFMGENYEISSLIGHYLLYDFNSAGIDLLVYPSKAHEADNFNLAIHPDFVDAHLQLKRVFKLRITHEDPQVSPRVVSIGDAYGDTVIWRALLENEEQTILNCY